MKSKKTTGLIITMLLATSTLLHAESISPQELLKNARIDCDDPNMVLQKGITEDHYQKAYTQAVVKIKNSTAIYYGGSFDETELDEIVKLKVSIQDEGIGGGNKKFSIGIANNGTTVVLMDYKYGTEWRADHCSVRQNQ
ncbi:hypothetical protein [Pectobacterium versatile]|uniref:hypothetical protein n=1 Tax=Pectobacterium versatile TaxID=2488639 RepID=UPI001CF2529A|nr:hypothetical protein [Pectobacterium versatile]MCA6926597.1 hypothetical protein [Pectobacterium versatile]MCH5083345.1 hypothetical protein [Pectobacterium versatile]